MSLAKSRLRIISFIKNNPGCTYRDVKKSTKLKVERYFPSMKEAYKCANVELPKRFFKRSLLQQKEDVINFIKINPECGVKDIVKEVGVSVPRVFGSIRNAYKLSDVKYPKRDFSSGVINPYILFDAINYENYVFSILRKLGKLNTKVKNKAGVADAVFVSEKAQYVVEVKNYTSSKITSYEVKQIVRYMKALNIDKGMIVCPKSSFPKNPNRRNIYKDGLNINICSPEHLCGGVV